MISDDTIKKLASNDSVYESGVSYFRLRYVVSIDKDPQKRNTYYAEVKSSGTETYKVTIELDSRDEVVWTGCDCPFSYLYGKVCKHVVAALKEIQREEMLNVKEPGRMTDAAKMLFSTFIVPPPEKKAAGFSALSPVRIEPRLCITSDFISVVSWLEFRIGRDKMYIMRSIKDFWDTLQSGGEFSFGKGFSVSPETLNMEPGISQALMDFIADAHETERSLIHYNYYFGRGGNLSGLIFSGKQLRLSPENLERFFDIMGNESFLFDSGDKEPVSVSVSENPLPVGVNISEEAGGARITIDNKDSIVPLDDSYKFVLVGNQIYKSDERRRDVLGKLLSVFFRHKFISVPEGELPDFFSRILPQLESAVYVQIDSTILARYDMSDLTSEATLDYDSEGDGITATVKFIYGDNEINPLADAGVQNLPGRRLIRDYFGEKRILDFFADWGFYESDGKFVTDDEEKSFDFFESGLDELKKIADVYYSENFKTRPVRDMSPVTVGVSLTGGNLLEITFKDSDFDFDELVNILKQYRAKKRYYRLGDRSFLRLSDENLETLSEFAGSVDLRRGKDGRATLPPAAALYIDALAKDAGAGALRLDRSREFRALVRDVREPDALPADPPQSLVGILRDYQRTGFLWLSALAVHGLGGILADDMGLGKTLETIAFLLAKKEEQNGRALSLVVCPTSLVYNWLDEIKKFAPGLCAVAITGSREERAEKIKDAASDAQIDVMITTYHTLRRDVEDYDGITFSFMFLDEAQKIKNPTTGVAKAVKRVAARVTYALTGTPVENTLTELWSVFDAVLPGYLGVHAEFRKKYEVPIVKDASGKIAKDLQRKISPFILRRLKKDVLPELPDKTESKMINEMTKEQEKVYRAYFVQSKKEFAEELRARGFQASRIKILSLLTRLRQIACDPSIFIENYAGGSGKLDMLEDVVPEAVAGGHRLLVFSQFTTMLKRIGERLGTLGVKYLYLDGATPAKDRVSLVKQFNAGSPDVFLISLKAGGTGLNLTGADMVIHYDPWWNPAVEDQATDRAYRIGQRQNVQVLKFITKDTIEEKIFELQEKKKKMIDQMIKPGDNLLLNQELSGEMALTEDEIRSFFE